MAGWTICITLTTVITFGTYTFVQEGYKFNPILDPTYLSLHGLAWALCIVWIVVACENGYGGSSYSEVLLKIM